MMIMRLTWKIVAAALITAFLASSCATEIPERPEVDVAPVKEEFSDGSLWPGVNKGNLLFSDNKASRVGDIVIVHVLEKTTALNKSDMGHSRSTTNKLLINTAVSDPATVPTNMNLSGGAEFKGGGFSGRSDQFSTTVSCLVKEVLANGNLVVEGQRRMTINKEKQYIIVRGIIRPDDITFNNSVLSSQMANADIIYAGGGPMDDNHSSGWLGQTLDFIWPF